ncbi:YhfT family protein [Virgibacillus salexigens]|uniref:YhfT family protein n=1 Tax=Virgibacillus salexigens TaxID=61016 RepID=UPI00190AEA66|nr:YhfT family protein [Virgibacillus salexigens]
MEMMFVILIGAVAAVLANMNIAVFNDGLRPIVSEHLEGRLKRRELGLTAFAMSFGLVVGFGIPFTITASIILIHSILLGTDIIGLMTPPKNKWGTAVAAIVGGLYGWGLLIGLEGFVKLFEYLPVNFLEPMGEVGTPVVVTFMAFPALAVAMQFSVKKGIITFIVAALIRQLAVFVNNSEFLRIGDNVVTLNQEGMALIAGMIFLFAFAMREKADEAASVDLASIFSEKVKQIKKNVAFFMIIGALIAGATNLLLMAGDPISLNLLAEGKQTDAGIAAAARAIGFIPLVASTAIATGVYSPVGFTLIFVVGLFVPNVWVAVIVGAIVIFLEVMLLSSIAKFLDKYPGVRNSGENIRSAMTKLLEVALLIGGANAANMIAPGFGFFFIAGFYLLNEVAGRPIVRMAVGPVGAIAVGVLANIFVLLGIMQVS